MLVAINVLHLRITEHLTEVSVCKKYSWEIRGMSTTPQERVNVQNILFQSSSVKTAHILAMIAWSTPG